MPATYDLSIYRGDTFRLSFSFQDSTGPVVLPTTGWSAQIRADAAATVVAASFTVDASGGATGQIIISLTAAQTETLQRGVWDLQSTSGSEVRTYLRGTVLPNQDVTRS